MTWTNFEHTHQWIERGVTTEDGRLHLVFECDECEAWSLREKRDLDRVPFKDGEFA